MPRHNNQTIIQLASEKDVVIMHTFNANMEQVFRACTDPDLIPQWWGPRNLKTKVEKIDLRKGGKWRYVQHDIKGRQYIFNGQYKQIKKPELLSYTFEYEGMPDHIVQETIKLEEQDGKTTVIMTDHFRSQKERDEMLETGLEVGVRESMERMEEVLETIH